eukprot:Rmarinus@m.26313
MDEETCSIVNATVSGYSFRQDGVVVYTIMSSSGKHEAEVEHRYRDFRYLHERLRNSATTKALPLLPTKLISLASPTNSQLKKRRTSLDSYIGGVARVCGRNPILLEFLGLSSALTHRRSNSLPSSSPRMDRIDSGSSLASWNEDQASAAPFEADTSVDKEGWLWKLGQSGIRSWQRRWIRLCGSEVLYSIGPEGGSVKGKGGGVINLALQPWTVEDVSTSTFASGRKHAFAIILPYRTFYFSAASDEEHLEWLKTFRNANRDFLTQSLLRNLDQYFDLCSRNEVSFVKKILTLMTRVVPSWHEGEATSSSSSKAKSWRRQRRPSVQRNSVTLKPEVDHMLRVIKEALSSKSFRRGEESDLLLQNLQDEKISEFQVDPDGIILCEKLAEGFFGEVFRGKLWDKEVAIKRLKAQRISSKQLEELRKEVHILSRLRHPNVLLYMGVCLQAPNFYYIVTEYMAKGTLYDVMKSECVHDTLFVRMVRDIIDGVNYLHKRNILHRDLKPLNLLVDEKYSVKVSDFGLSTLKAKTLNPNEDDLHYGTILYMAPEVVFGPSYGFPSDVFSFGIVLYEWLHYRDHPEDNFYDNMTQAFELVRDPLEKRKPPKIPFWWPAPWSELISTCVEKDPAKRPNFDEISHWLEELEQDTTLYPDLNAAMTLMAVCRRLSQEHKDYAAQSISPEGEPAESVIVDTGVARTEVLKRENPGSQVHMIGDTPVAFMGFGDLRGVSAERFEAEGGISALKRLTKVDNPEAKACAAKALCYILPYYEYEGALEAANAFLSLVRSGYLMDLGRSGGWKKVDLNGQSKWVQVDAALDAFLTLSSTPVEQVTDIFLTAVGELQRGDEELWDTPGFLSLQKAHEDLSVTPNMGQDAANAENRRRSLPGPLHADLTHIRPVLRLREPSCVAGDSVKKLPYEFPSMLDDLDVERCVQTFLHSVDIDSIRTKHVIKFLSNQFPEVNLYQYKDYVADMICRVVRQMEPPSRIIPPKPEISWRDVEPIKINESVQGELYLGTTYNARHAEELKAISVDAIIDLTRTDEAINLPSSMQVPSRIETVRFPFADQSDEDLLTVIENVEPHLDGWLAAGKHVLMHCNRGVSRSPAVIVGYLMRRWRCSLRQALRFVKACRGGVNLNRGFHSQLEALESHLRQGRRPTAAPGSIPSSASVSIPSVASNPTPLPKLGSSPTTTTMCPPRSQSLSHASASVSSTGPCPALVSSTSALSTSCASTSSASVGGAGVGENSMTCIREEEAELTESTSAQAPPMQPS